VRPAGLERRPAVGDAPRPRWRWPAWSRPGCGLGTWRTARPHRILRRCLTSKKADGSSCTSRWPA